MGITVRAGDVYVLPIPGDNGQTKDRRCVILDCYPSATSAQIVSLVFGCSETKKKARAEELVRIEREPVSVFRALYLLNPTTFHQEDIRHYDAWSPRLELRYRKGFCPPSIMIAMRRLAEARNSMRDPIPMLPDKARDDAKQAGRAWQGLPSGDRSADSSDSDIEGK